MPGALTVHVNREGLHSLEVPDSFETASGFDVVLVNHGGATHVSLQLDDSLSEQAAIEAPNHHVQGGSERRVRIAREDDGAARGTLTVITAHGNRVRLVDVALTEPVETDGSAHAERNRPTYGAEPAWVYEKRTDPDDPADPEQTDDEPTASEPAQMYEELNAPGGEAKRAGSSRLRSDERRALAVGAVVVLALSLTAGVATGNLRAVLAVVVPGGLGVVAAVSVSRAL